MCSCVACVWCLCVYVCVECVLYVHGVCVCVNVCMWYICSLSVCVVVCYVCGVCVYDVMCAMCVVWCM